MNGSPRQSGLPPGLSVHIGPSSYSVGPADVPITIGRPGRGATPVRIRVADRRISVNHLTLDVAGGRWIATDRSRNGTFADGRRGPRFEIVDGLTVRLGHPVEGIAIRFKLHDLRTAAGDSTVRTALITETVDTSFSAITDRIAELPDVADPRFPRLATGVLTDLTRLATMVLHAARAAPGAAGLVSRLSAIRKAHGDLTLRAARSPGAPLGLRLYAARRRAGLTVADAAELCGMVADEIRGVEAGGALVERDAAALRRLLAILP